MTNFEVFKRQNSRKGGPTTTLTIGRRGQLSIGRDAYRELGEPEAVELLYDRGNKTVGLRPVQPDAPTAYRIRGGDNISPTVTGTAFLQHYDIPFGGAAYRHRAEMRAGVLCIDLNTPSVDVTSNRAKQREIPCNPAGRTSDT